MSGYWREYVTLWREALDDSRFRRMWLARVDLLGIHFLVALAWAAWSLALGALIR